MLISSQAQAISRHHSQQLSCERIHELIRAEGAAILRYTSKRVAGLPLYDRYVRHDGYCGFGQYAKAVSVPARDTPSCPVFKCEQKTYDDGLFYRQN